MAAKLVAETGAARTASSGAGNPCYAEGCGMDWYVRAECVPSRPRSVRSPTPPRRRSGRPGRAWWASPECCVGAARRQSSAAARSSHTPWPCRPNAASRTPVPYRHKTSNPYTKAVNRASLGEGVPRGKMGRMVRPGIPCADALAARANGCLSGRLLPVIAAALRLFGCSARSG